MAVDFNAWLQNDQATRNLLVDVKNYDDSVSPAVEQTEYFSLHGFTTEPADSPANTHYEQRITGQPSFTRSMDEAKIGGRTFIANGFIEFQNDDGGLDRWLDLAWDGRDIIIRLGDPAWSFSDYVVVLTGKIDRLIVESDKIMMLAIRDRQADLDVPANTNHIDENEGSTNKKPIPLCFGNCSNIAPVLLDDLTHKYQVHDGTVEDVCVQLYVNGVSSAISVTKDNAAGTFTLNSDPGGKVTCDAKGAKPAGTWLEKPGAIIRELVSGVGPLADPADLDTASFTDFDTDLPYQMGLFVRDRANLLDVLDSILPMGWWYGFDKDGKFELGVVKDPAGLTSELDVSNIETQDSITLLLDEPPAWRVRINRERNWTVQTLGNDATVTEARQVFLENKWRVSEYSDSSVQTKHLEARDPDAMDSMISLNAGGALEAERVHDLISVQRFRYEVMCHVSPYQLEIGSVVTLYDDRYGLESGVKCLVTAITQFYVDNRVQLELWR